MLNHVLVFLKDELNKYMNRQGFKDFSVHFPKEVTSQNQNSTLLKGVNLLLVNIEEESINRQADPFIRYHEGEKIRAYPEIRLNLYVLFVVDSGVYETSMKLLSGVIKYFQYHKIFDRSNAPDLSQEIHRLSVELVTLPFSEQNEIWNALRLHYMPSALYKVRMVASRKTVLSLKVLPLKQKLY